MLQLIQHKVSSAMNDELCREFTDEEIFNAMFQIGPLKAPGPDGFPARFFQRHWAVFKIEITAAVKLFFDTGVMPEGVNATTIVLIPKVDTPTRLTDFRPISLCNVIYKVIAKCLVNRLRPMLDELVSPVQSAFVPGRLITDNALIAFECFHAIKQEKDPERSFCAYKLDLSKAYDRVDWVFLKRMMQQLGFSHRWVSWIMECVTSVRYNVKINGALSDSFAPSCGLRQGDPISPFLFLFVADGLDALLKQEIEATRISPLRVCPQAPGISHLLFAGDTLLFFRANAVEAAHVRAVLERYAAATDQIVNPNKCSIMFGPSCSEVNKQEVMHTLKVVNASFEEKYLGFPTPNGRLSKGKLKSVQQQLTKRIIQWGELMSQAGREVLIKAVAQALPTFLMSIFKFPRSTCDDLARMIRSYWWGAYRGKRKTHWKAWDHLLQPKAAGGMGFKDFRMFNQALLARQAWRLLVNPESLRARVLKERYYPNGRLEDTVFSTNASQTWQSIVHGLELLKQGLIWRIGNGRSVRIWRDPWIPHPTGRPLISQQGRCILRRVSELLDETGAWRPDLLQQYFLPVDVHHIMKIKASPRLGDDFIAWGAERTGIFTVRSAYRLALEDKLRPSSVAASRAPDG